MDLSQYLSRLPASESDTGEMLVDQASGLFIARLPETYRLVLAPGYEMSHQFLLNGAYLLTVKRVKE